MSTLHHDEFAVVVGVELRDSLPPLSVDESLDELVLLAETAGIGVRARITQKLSKIVSSTFIGAGKLEELRSVIDAEKATLVIFDDELSPRHQRELEQELGDAVRVLDRSALILDIFAQHAHTREGTLQVELAQYEYRLPRLTRQWTHLARQVGGGAARGGSAGVGLRGPGETQLEVDRREISRKIAKLKEELEAVRAHRQRHRLQRERAGLPTISLVGYTNAGKSTLLRALSGADVYVADQLFATLDTTTRRIKLPAGQTALLSDTVGFIQKLPVSLIAAFRATLEEVVEADILLHVVDVSHPNTWDHVDIVEDTLAHLDATRIPKILILNKVDRGIYNPTLDFSTFGYKDILEVSALTGQGLDTLRNAIQEVLQQNLVSISLHIPYTQGELLSSIYDGGIVEKENHASDGIYVQAKVPKRLAGYLDSQLGRGATEKGTDQ